MLGSEDKVERNMEEIVGIRSGDLLGNYGVTYPMDTGTLNHGYRRREDDTGDHVGGYNEEILGNSVDELDRGIDMGDLNMNMNMLAWLPIAVESTVLRANLISNS